MEASKQEWSVVETDNFSSDYPSESFVIRRIRLDAANDICDLINVEKCNDGMGSRYWKVEKDSHEKPYELQPGFEP